MTTIHLSALKDSFGRVVWTHKVHEKQAEIYSLWADVLDWASVILSALTSAALLYVLLKPETRLTVSVILSFIALFVRLLQLIFSPRSKKESHKATAKQLWSIKEKYINLIADLLSNSISQEQIIQKRDNLTNELSAIYSNALQTSSYAMKKANNALKVKDEHTFYKNEVEKFLPIGLREVEN